jgi:hypothetical protein
MLLSPGLVPPDVFFEMACVCVEKIPTSVDLTYVHSGNRDEHKSNNS